MGDLCLWILDRAVSITVRGVSGDARQAAPAPVSSALPTPRHRPAGPSSDTDTQPAASSAAGGARAGGASCGGRSLVDAAAYGGCLEAAAARQRGDTAAARRRVPRLAGSAAEPAAAAGALQGGRVRVGAAAPPAGPSCTAAPWDDAERLLVPATGHRPQQPATVHSRCGAVGCDIVRLDAADDIGAAARTDRPDAPQQSRSVLHSASEPPSTPPQPHMPDQLARARIRHTHTHQRPAKTNTVRERASIGHHRTPEPTQANHPQPSIERITRRRIVPNTA